MFFKSHLGKREQAESDQTPATQAPTPEPQPFGATLGERPVQSVPAGVQRRPVFTHCPLCRGELKYDAGLWLCQGRCHARWIVEHERLLDVAALPYGICACCAEPQALVRSTIGFATCPTSARIHLLNSDGTRLLVDTLIDGTCACCSPMQPLARIGAQIVCTRQPHEHYVRAGDTWQRLTSTKLPSASLDAIDQALRENTAKVGLYGLFDVDEQ